MNQLITWKNSLIESWNQVRVSTFTEAVKSTSPVLKELVSEHGEIMVKAILTKKIAGIVKFFNVGKSMNDIQIADTISLILEHYPRLKPEDIELCFKKAKSGQYGQLYDRLDGQVILGWIFAYTQAKSEFVEHNNFIIHKENKLLNEAPSTTEGKKAGFELLKKSYVEPVKKGENKKLHDRSKDYTKKTIEAPSREINWLNQFDSTHLKRPRFTHNEQRAIFKYGKMMLCSDFMEQKMKQFNLVSKVIICRHNLGKLDLAVYLNNKTGGFQLVRKDQINVLKIKKERIIYNNFGLTLNS